MGIFGKKKRQPDNSEELNRLKQENTNLEGRILELNQRLSDALQQLEAKNKQYAQLEQKNALLEKENRENNAKLNAVVCQIKREKEAAAKEVKDLYEQQMRALKGEYQQLNERYQSIQKEYSNLQEELRKKNEDIKKYKDAESREKVERREKMGELVAKISRLEERYKSLEEEKKRVEEKNRTLEEEIKKISALYSKIDERIAVLKKTRKVKELKPGQIISVIMYEKIEEERRTSGYLALADEGLIYVRTSRKIEIPQERSVCIMSIPLAEARIIDNPNVVPEVGKVYPIEFNEKTGKGLSAICKNGKEVVLPNIGNGVTGYQGMVKIVEEKNGIFYAKPLNSKK